MSKKILLFNNLMVAVFDEDGKQVGVLQHSLAELLATAFEVNGYDPMGATIECQWGGNWRIVNGENGWRHEEAVPPSFECPQCDAKSYSLYDIENRFCRQCQVWW